MNSPELNAPESWNECFVLGGKVKLRQPNKGHRAGLDAVLLAACLPETATGLVLDIGAGVGTVGLAAAMRAPQIEVVLVERDTGQAEFARQNITLNGLGNRARVCAGDILTAKTRAAAGLSDRMAKVILTNPPYYPSAKVRASPEPLKAEAYAMEASLEDWMRACAALLAPKGTLYMVHLASALAEVLAAATSRFGDVKIMPIYSRAGEAASRILVRATKGSRAAPSLMPGLVVHSGADYSAEAEAILRGLAALNF